MAPTSAKVTGSGLDVTGNVAVSGTLNINALTFNAETQNAGIGRVLVVASDEVVRRRQRLLRHDRERGVSERDLRRHDVAARGRPANQNGSFG